MRPLRTLIPALMLLAGLACAETVQLPGLGVQLTLPAGWSIARTVEGVGVSLRAADGSGTLDVLAWIPVAEKLSAAAAAEAHEQVLSARATWQRTAREKLTAADGSDAVVVTGTLQVGQTAPEDCLFAAYQVGQMYVVIGTVTEPGGLARARTAFFDAAAKSLAPAGFTPRPAPIKPVTPASPGATANPVTPAGAGQNPAPGAATPTVTPAVTPTPPARIVPTVPALADASVAEGLRMRLPTGWSREMMQGCLVSWPPGPARTAGLAVWPLLRQGNQVIQDRANAAMKAFATLLRGTLQIAQLRLASGQELSAVCCGELAVDAEPLEFVAILAPAGGVDLLQVALYAPETEEADRLRLAEALGSFSYDPLCVLPPGGPTAGQWGDAMGALKARTDDGWAVSGGVRLYNGAPVIEVEGSHLGSGARFTWRQPEAPAFKTLTDDLKAAGWQEGSDFAPERGTDALQLARKIGPEALARQRASFAGSGVATSSASARAAKLLPGSAGAVAEVRSTDTQAVALVAIGAAPAELGADCWLAASLRYEGPRATYKAAGLALRRFILSADVPTTWDGTPQEKVALLALIDGAREAANDLPGQAPPLGNTLTVAPVLSFLAGETTPGVERLECPASAGWLWHLAATRDGAQQVLPELNTGDKTLTDEEH
jgi:hypothetical protein